MVRTTNILGDRQTSCICQLWGAGRCSRKRPLLTLPLLWFLQGSRASSPPLSVAPRAERGARPLAARCWVLAPLVPPSQPEAQGPTDSDSGPRSWVGPQFLSSEVHGPRGEWWQEEEACPCSHAGPRGVWWSLQIEGGVCVQLSMGSMSGEANPGARDRGSFPKQW